MKGAKEALAYIILNLGHSRNKTKIIDHLNHLEKVAGEITRMPVREDEGTVDDKI